MDPIKDLEAMKAAMLGLEIKPTEVLPQTLEEAAIAVDREDAVRAHTSATMDAFNRTVGQGDYYYE